jgi:hypothetical protein
MNPAIGRFQTMDGDEGAQEDPQSLHKYLFANGDPIDKNDPSGNDSETVGSAETRLLQGILPGTSGDYVTMYLRSFAPWPTFGGGFTGDARSFTTTVGGDVTSRLSAKVVFDVSTHTIIGTPSADIIRSSYRVSSNYVLSATGIADLNAYQTSNGIHVDLSGSLALFHGAAPNINLHLDMGTSVGADGKTDYYGGTLSGTAFPDAEIFVYKGNKATVLDEFTTKGSRNWGPYTYLPFNGYQPMGSFAVHD